MVKKVIILKESELVKLIQQTVRNIKSQQLNEDWKLYPHWHGDGRKTDIEKLYDWSADVVDDAADVVEDVWEDITDFGEDVVNAVGDFFVDVGDWAYGYFIDCGNAQECAKRWLDGVAIIGAFVPGAGWVVSGIAGGASSLIRLNQGDYAGGTAGLVFELFPLTRVTNRLIKGVKGLKATQIDEVTKKMLKSDFDAKVYKSFKGDKKKAADYLIKNVDEIEADVLKAVKNLKNNSATKNLMKLSDSELRAVAIASKVDYQNLKIVVNLMKTQAKHIDDYASFFNKWRNVAKEFLFYGSMIGAGLGTYLGTTYIMRKFWNNDKELLERIKKEILEAGGGTGDQLGTMLDECALLAELKIMLNTDCATWFKNWLTRNDGDGAFFDVPEYENIEDLFRQYISQFDEGEDRHKEIKRIFDSYGGQDACVYLKTTPGKTYDSIYLDYYMEALEEGDCKANLQN